MTSHPLDRVESALVDASNALQDVDDIHIFTLPAIDAAIDTALGLVQAEIRADRDQHDPRD